MQLAPVQNIYSSNQTHQGSTLTLILTLPGPATCSTTHKIAQSSRPWWKSPTLDVQNPRSLLFKVPFQARYFEAAQQSPTLPLFTAIHVWGWMKCWFLSGCPNTPICAPDHFRIFLPPPFMFDSVILVQVDGHIQEQFQFWYQSGGWQFLRMPMTLACVPLFQITSSLRHGCGRPTAAPQGGCWLDNLVTGMGWNWQNRWLAPILWTRDWPFPAHDQNLKRQKHEPPKRQEGGGRRSPGSHWLQLPMLKLLICFAPICLAVKTVLITKPKKHHKTARLFSSQVLNLMWTMKFSSARECTFLHCTAL